MKTRISFRSEASVDVAEAFSYYRARDPALADAFDTELYLAVGLIRAAPLAGMIVYRDIRRVLMRRFPFAVYYSVSDEGARIEAVLHFSRDPRTWQKRL